MTPTTTELATTEYADPALASFITAFDDNTASMVGNVELNGAMYVLSTKTLDTTNYRIDPDGTRSYLTSVTVTKIGNGQILEQNEIAQLYAGGLDATSNNDRGLARGAIDVVSGGIKVFFCEKDAGGSYGQNGYAYTIDAQTLASSSSSVFTNANWGWYPSIDSNGDVVHFSFAGYYMYKNTDFQYDIAPSEAALLAENQKLVTADLSGDLTTAISADALSALLVDDLKAFVGTPVVNDTPGVVFTDTAGLTVTESGGTASFEVALQAVPRHDVILTFTISDASEGGFASSGTSTLSLTFTAENWSTPQSVTLVGVDDELNDGDMAFIVSTRVSSDDLRYDGMRSGTGLSIANLVVTNTDNDAPDELYGDAGGVATADLLHGGNGASDIYGKDGRDEISGGNGDDRLYGGYGDDVLYGEADNDELEGDQGNDKLNGGSGNDFLTGATGKDTLLGGDGNDTLDGSSDADAMNGGNGADTYYVDSTGDIVSDSGTDTGKDTVYVTAFLATGYTLGAGIDNAALQALATNAALTGNTGHNSLSGNASDNALDGGAGNDSLSGGAGADILSGGLGDDILYAGSGNDAVDAGDGNDLIVGGDGAGNDRYSGGAGRDTVKYTSATASISVNLSTGSATGANIGSDTLAQIENVIGGNYSDSLTGNAGANQLEGYDGNDTLNGGAGNDTLAGGRDNDTYYVRDAGDVVAENTVAISLGGTDVVYSYLSSYTLTNNVENGQIRTAGTASLNGNTLNNVLHAGAGNNILNGGSGTDTASYAYAATAIKVSLAVSTGQLTGGSGTDTLSGIESLIGSNFNDTLAGSTLANSLSGGAGNDILSAGAGNDVLAGGLGADKLTGGSGSDRFDFNVLTELGLSSTTRDTIADFKASEADKIDLLGVDANTALAGNQAFGYLGTAAFSGNATAKLRFDAVSHILYGSTDADTTAEFSIVLTGVASLAATDLVL